MTLLFLNLWLFFSFVLVLHYVFWHGEIVACTTPFLSSSLLALRISPSYTYTSRLILKFDMSDPFLLFKSAHIVIMIIDHFTPALVEK